MFVMLLSSGSTAMGQARAHFSIITLFLCRISTYGSSPYHERCGTTTTRHNIVKRVAASEGCRLALCRRRAVHGTVASSYVKTRSEFWNAPRLSKERLTVAGPPRVNFGKLHTSNAYCIPTSTRGGVTVVKRFLLR